MLLLLDVWFSVRLSNSTRLKSRLFVTLVILTKASEAMLNYNMYRFAMCRFFKSSIYTNLFWNIYHIVTESTGKLKILILDFILDIDPLYTWSQDRIIMQLF